MKLQKIEIPTPSLEILVRSLARVQEPWRPVRRAEFGAATYFFRTTKSPLALVGGAGRERSKAFYYRGLLVAKRLLTPTGRPTVTGKRLARSLVWTFSVDELREAVRRLKCCVKRRDVLEDSGEKFAFVPDSLVCGEYWGWQNCLLERMFAPLLCDQLLVGIADAHGQPFYALAVSPAALTKAIGSLVANIDVDEHLENIFQTECEKVRSEIANYRVTTGELGILPLPVGELESRRDYLEAIGVEPLFDLNDE